MKVKMISSTNNAFESLFGLQVDLHIDMIATYSFDSNLVDDFNFRHGTCRTSQIKSIVYDEISMGCTNIIIKTRNSEYIFQHGEPSNEKPLTKEEILAFQMGLGMHLF